MGKIKKLLGKFGICRGPPYRTVPCRTILKQTMGYNNN